MIFFVANDGTIIKGMPSPVYQGAANTNTIYLIAPFATNTAVTVAFQLPNGVWTEPAAMTAQNALQGIVNEETGQTYAGWTYDIPSNITEYYGTVTAQFFFYSAQAGVITATSATSFQVGRGVPAVLPDTPAQDIYEDILSNLAALQTQLNNGTFAARSIYAWNSTYTYSANEITFYPNIGEFGAFVQSVQTGNTNNAPYIDGSLNSAWWKEVVNFNTIAEDFFTDIKNAQTAAEAAQTAAEAAQEAAEEAENQAVSAAENSETSASAARTYSLVAESLAQQAGNSATSASGQAYQAAGSAQEAKSSEEAAAQSALAAQGYMEQAKEYAQKEYKIYDSLEDLPMPGDSAFIYLVPSNSGTSGDSYSEYLWISETNSYEYIGSVNDVDLSNYAQINGTYPNMTVGNAANATNAESAEKATQDGNGNVITSTYATKAENNAKYTKPASGIPLSDLASSVQDTLNESISDSEVINYLDALPSTVDESSPSFVSVSGVLYQKVYTVSPADDSVLLGTWAPNTNVLSGISAFDTGISQTAIGTLGNTPIYGSRYSSDRLWFDDDPNHSSGQRGDWVVDTDDGLWSNFSNVTFNENADTITNHASLLSAMQHFYIKQQSETYGYQQVGNDFNPSGTYNNLTAGKAVADGNGNNIADTYATKASVEFMTNAEVDALFS